MFRSLSCLAVLAFAACASTIPPTPQDTPVVASKAAIKIYETTCFFSCASYEIVVRPDGRYSLNNMKNTRADGASEGTLAPDVWVKAQAAFDAAQFATLPDRLDRPTMTSGIYCMNDLPDIHFTRIAADGTEKKVVWMTGCPLPDMRALSDTLRTLFRYNELVKPG
jgi:hypothetical protein